MDRRRAGTTPRTSPRPSAPAAPRAAGTGRARQPREADGLVLVLAVLVLLLPVVAFFTQ